MAEIAGERDERRGQGPEPPALAFERQPQRGAGKRDADPKEVIQKAPQEHSVVEQQERKQRPHSPRPCGHAIQPYRSACYQAEDRDQEQLRRNIERHQPRERRHDQILREIGQRLPMHGIELIAALAEEVHASQMIGVIEERRQHRREQRHCRQNHQQRKGAPDPEGCAPLRQNRSTQGRSSTSQVQAERGCCNKCR